MTEWNRCLMTPAETAALVRLVPHLRVLEMGCWTGYTTVAMVRAGAVVWTIDEHRGDLTASYGYGPPAVEFGKPAPDPLRARRPNDTLRTYFENLEVSGVRDQVVSIVGRFERVLQHLRPGAFDVVLVDGAHNFESVQFDVLMARDLLRGRGWLVLHDWERHEVSKAARPILGEPDELTDTLAVWKIRP